MAVCCDGLSTQRSGDMLTLCTVLMREGFLGKVMSELCLKKQRGNRGWIQAGQNRCCQVEWKDQQESAAVRGSHMWLGVGGAQKAREGVVSRGNYEGFLCQARDLALFSVGSRKQLIYSTRIFWMLLNLRPSNVAMISKTDITFVLIKFVLQCSGILLQFCIEESLKIRTVRTKRKNESFIWEL